MAMALKPTAVDSVPTVAPCPSANPPPGWAPPPKAANRLSTDVDRVVTEDCAPLAVETALLIEVPKVFTVEFRLTTELLMPTWDVLIATCEVETLASEELIPVCDVLTLPTAA